MESVFLSYTYNPHADVQEATKRLVTLAKIVIESLELRVVDGVHLGGEAIDDELRQRITGSDALVAIMTPKADEHDHPVMPAYVDDEYKLAKAENMPAIRILDESLQLDGMHQYEEYISFEPANESLVLIKLLRTLALWKQEHGTPKQVEIDPPELGNRFEQGRHGHRCEYQLLTNYQAGDWQPAQIWYEPGATYAHLPGVPDDAKIKLRLDIGHDHWESAFSNPLGRIALQEVG